MRDSMKKRITSVLLVLVMLLLLPAGALTARAAKQETSRAIAVVLDNSGSMYIRGNEAWCRAAYAMEVFAAMMNNGDIMQVYPMYEVNVGSSTYDSYNPLTINGPKDASIIRQISTPMAGGTPIETISHAYEGLKKTSAQEKWLVVLTDGESFWRNNQDIGSRTKGALTDVLESCAKDVQVMYLGIGSQATVPDVKNAAKQYFDKASSSDQVLTKLTAMCNRIFGRDALENVGTTFDVDVTMSKMIIFVQGENVSDVAIDGGNLISRQDTHYSEAGTTDDRYMYDLGIDRKLQGMIATYEDVPAGSFAINYSGTASSVSVYYEPDVDLRVELVDETGKSVDPNASDLTAGKYTLKYYLVDKNGNPTTSALLKTVNYTIDYVLNGETKTVNVDQPGTIDLDLEKGDTLDGDFRVSYLSGYTIHKTAEDIGWPAGGIVINARPAGQLNVSLTGGAATYPLSKLEEQAVYQVKLTYEGNELSGSGLDTADIQVSVDGGLKTAVEKTADGWTVSVKHAGEPSETACQDYTLTVRATYVNEEGTQSDSQPASAAFKVEDDSTALLAELVLEQDFYVTSQMDKAKPMVVRLTAGGAPLTPEQFAATTLTVDLESLDFDLEPDPANSRYIITLNADKDTPQGRYKVTVRADGFDEVGRPVSSEAEDQIQLKPYPRWIYLLFWLLVALILFAMIWAFLNVKILPKRIGAGKCNFIVDGSIIPGTPSCVFTGGNKKKGSLEIISPKYMANPGVKCGFRLELEAVSPRRTRSSSRAVKVLNITPLNPASTTSIHIGAVNMIRDPNTGKLVKSGAKSNGPVTVQISNNAKTTVTAEVLDINDGSEIAVSMSLPLKFY